MHSDEQVQRWFVEYRKEYEELAGEFERRKTVLDTELGKKLESLGDNANIQCEVTPDRRGVIVTYYRIDPMMTLTPDIEPKVAKSAFFRDELYYTPEEIVEIAKEEEDDDDEEVGIVQDDGTYTPASQPEGANIDVLLPKDSAESTGQGQA